MAEQKEQDNRPWPTGTVTFKNRQILVSAPSPEQIMVWQRIMNRLSDLNLSDWSGKEVLAAIEQSRSIIDSIIKNREDVEWLDAEMLAGRVGLREASDIISQAVHVLASDQGPRQEPAQKPSARRKKATT